MASNFAYCRTQEEKSQRKESEGDDGPERFTLDSLNPASQQSQKHAHDSDSQRPETRLRFLKERDADQDANRSTEQEKSGQPWFHSVQSHTILGHRQS
jgi:hypothetical protein